MDMHFDADHEAVYVMNQWMNTEMSNVKNRRCFNYNLASTLSG